MFSKLLLTTTLFSSTALAENDPNWRAFIDFKQHYNLEFESMNEDAKRFEIFKANMQIAETLNDRAEMHQKQTQKDDHTAKLADRARFGITKFMHMTPIEFKRTYLGYKKTSRMEAIKKTMKRRNKDQSKSTISSKLRGKKSYKSPNTASIDWRDHGAITPVKDQGQCGSCWAFSATEAVESGYFLNTNKLVKLSPQQVTSCDKVDLGCGGGNTATAYEYIREAGGLEKATDYPYTSGDSERTGWCKAEPAKFKVQVGDSTIISESADGEPDMLDEIQSTPMSVCVDAEPWQFYMGGVIDSSTCGTELDHCVHLVGYKADGDYWIVKNSWNVNWGEEGYIYVKQGENACGIALETSVVDAEDEDSANGHRYPKPQDAIAVIKGVAKGMGITMVDECVAAGTELFQRLEKAYELMQHRTIVNVAEAMKLIAEALESDLPNAAQTCEVSEKDVKNIIKALSIIKNPTDFMYHVGHDLSINGVEIYKEVNDAIGAYKTAHYDDFGLAIGEVLEMVLVGNPVSKGLGSSSGDEVYV